MLLAARMVVVNIQESTWTPDEAARAEQAWRMRTYGSVPYLRIAEKLGYQQAGDKYPAEVAMAAVLQFGEEIEAGLRPAPAEPKRQERQAWLAA